MPDRSRATKTGRLASQLQRLQRSLPGDLFASFAAAVA
jgi:hypothetical protein